MSKDDKPTKLEPRLRFPEFKGGLGWDIPAMSDLYGFRSTNSLSRDQLNYDSGSIYNIHYGDIHTKFRTQFRLDSERVPFIDPTVAEELGDRFHLCREGDIILADASDLNDVGKGHRADLARRSSRRSGNPHDPRHANRRQSSDRVRATYSNQLPSGAASIKRPGREGLRHFVDSHRRGSPSATSHDGRAAKDRGVPRLARRLDRGRDGSPCGTTPTQDRSDATTLPPPRRNPAAASVSGVS